MDARALHKENPWGLSMPLDILVGSGSARKTARNLHCHIGSGQFPPGSFVRVAPDLVVSSPELCFLQMAGELPLIDLVVLGFEFCGSYRLGRQSEPEQGLRADRPLSSVAKLSAYLEKTAGLKGHKNAMYALKFIVDRSASPMETALCLLLTLPCRLGGYGLPQPQLNHGLGASNKTRKIGPSKGSEFYGDLYWPEQRVDVEYDSDAYHNERKARTKDGARRNALTTAGETVLTVSKEQIMQTDGLRTVARELSALLGKRLRDSGQDFRARHALLRARLLPKISADR